MFDKPTWFGRQLENGNLLYANRKKAINEILQRSPNWPIPEEKVDNLLSAPNVANEEDLVKLKSENPTYYQTAADKDLVVYHNVSAGKLREAIKLGGLPMPSLAITRNIFMKTVTVAGICKHRSDHRRIFSAK